MEKNVLIIDDDFGSYSNISSAFEEYKWNVYPNKKSWLDDWDPIFDKDAKYVQNFIDSYCKENYKKIDLIILDIRLLRHKGNEIISDRTGRDVILPTIRDISGERQFKDWGKKVPIIALSRIEELEEEKILFDSGITLFLLKSDFETSRELLVSAALSSYNLYYLWFNTSSDEHKPEYFQMLMDQYDVIINTLSNFQSIVLSKLDGIDLTMTGDLDEIKEKLNLIFNISFKSLKDSQKSELFDEFKDTIVRQLGVEKYSQILSNINKPTYKEQFMKAVKDGSIAEFSDFLNNVVQFAVDNKILDAIPMGKLIGIGISSIFKLLSK